jgi:hypothetical protein
MAINRGIPAIADRIAVAAARRVFRNTVNTVIATASKQSTVSVAEVISINGNEITIADGDKTITTKLTGNRYYAEGSLVDHIDGFIV